MRLVEPARLQDSEPPGVGKPPLGDQPSAGPLAHLEGQPERPAVFFEIAARLESWNLLTQAREFVERGSKLAGQDLLKEPRHADE